MRPFFGDPIDRLEILAADDSLEHGTLLSLRDEVLHRTTHRAARLRALLDNKLASDPLPFVGADTHHVPEAANTEQLDLPLPTLDWSVRAAGVLRSLGVETVRDLSRCTPTDLLAQRNCGRKTVWEIGARLRQMGASLAAEGSPETAVPPTITDDQMAALNLPVTKFTLSTRARNCLDARDIRTLGELCPVSEAELMQLPNMGRKTVAELKALLARFGLRMGIMLEDWRVGEPHGFGQPALPEIIAPPEPTSLVEALWSRAVAVAGDGRNARWTIEHLGWDGAPARTLEQIGTQHGVTRERVRQVVAKACGRLAEREFVPDALRRTLALVEAHVPLGVMEFDTLLREHGIADAPFHPESVRKAAAVFGLPFPFVFDRRHEGWLLLPAELENLPDKLLRAVRATINVRGAINIDQVAVMATTFADRECTSDLVATILRSDPGVASLAGASDWWWRPRAAATARNRVLNLARKVVAVARTIALRDLRDAIRRQPRTGYYAPPLATLRALLAEQGDFVIDAADRVSASARGLDPDTLLSPLERQLIAIVRGAGPVIDGPAFSRLGAAAGINDNSLTQHKSYSPLLWRPVRGMFAVVGADVPVGLIEELQAKLDRAQRRAPVESGWTSDQQLFLCRRLSEAMARNGLISFPSALERPLAGRWEVRGSSNEVYPVEARQNVLSGLREWLRWQGAEAGDTLVVTFDPRSRHGRAWLGPPALLDEITADGFDRFHARALAELGEHEEGEAHSQRAPSEPYLTLVV